MKIEFANGTIAQVAEMNDEIFAQLQQKYKSAIVIIDGQEAAFWNGNDKQIKTNNEAVKIYQANCKHNKGYITNTGGGGSQCVICGKPIF